MWTSTTDGPLTGLPEIVAYATVQRGRGAARKAPEKGDPRLDTTGRGVVRFVLSERIEGSEVISPRRLRHETVLGKPGFLCARVRGTF